MNYTKLLVWKLSSPLCFKYRFLKGQEKPWRGENELETNCNRDILPSLLFSPCHFWQLGHYFLFPVKDWQALKKDFQSFALCFAEKE